MLNSTQNWHRNPKSTDISSIHGSILRIRLPCSECHDKTGTLENLGRLSVLLVQSVESRKKRGRIFNGGEEGV